MNCRVVLEGASKCQVARVLLIKAEEEEEESVVRM